MCVPENPIFELYRKRFTESFLEKKKFSKKFPEKKFTESFPA
jgi:hypothetical protein